MKKLAEIFTVFVMGVMGYGILETLWRGHTHWTMGITGGVCFFLVYWIQQALEDLPYWGKALMGAMMITAVEFLVGSVVNLKLGWQIWDYSGQPFNLLGQVCILYAVLWFFLCLFLCPMCQKLEEYLHCKRKDEWG